MNNDQVRDLQEIAERVQVGLAQLGLCYEVKKAGLTVGVSFRRLALVDQGDGGVAEFGLLEVDTLTLPRRVTADKLVRAATLHHLAAVVGRPVYHLNSTGITYCVDLRPATERGRGAVQLPQHVDYEQSTRPAEIGAGAVALGMTDQGPLWVDPERLGNLLLVGAQGSGKSALLRLLCYQALKAGWRLGLADADGVTFNSVLWRGAEPLMGGAVANSPQEVGRLFALALAEIERRSELFNAAPGYPDNLSEFNTATGADLPRVVLIVDEANTYFSSGGLAEQAADLARRARKWGLHCVFGGHNWRASEVPRALSAMVQTRLAFRVSDNTSGRVVLESDGAEQLPAIPGRAIVRIGGEYRLMQTYFLDKARLIALVERLPRVEPRADETGRVVSGWQDLAGDVESEETDDWPELWGYAWPKDPDGLREVYELAGDEERKAIIRRMLTKGTSKNGIQRALFGYCGGAAYDAVAGALAGIG